MVWIAVQEALISFILHEIGPPRTQAWVHTVIWDSLPFQLEVYIDSKE